MISHMKAKGNKGYKTVIFFIHREKHNLDCCRTQFKLVADIENKLYQKNEINKKYL